VFIAEGSTLIRGRMRMAKHGHRTRRRGLAPVAAVALTVVMVLGLAAGASSAGAGSETASSDMATVSPAPVSVASDAPEVRKRRVFVPFVSRTASTAGFFADDFELGVDNWTPYTNLENLVPEQWYWDEDGGYEGSAGYTFHHSRGGLDPEDAITLYLGGGSQKWTDYRASVRFNVRLGDKAGLWLRGTYRDKGFPGQWFEGYYCMVRVEEAGVGEGFVQLLKLRTLEDPENPPPDYYHFANPYELDARTTAAPLRPKRWYQLTVEARGPNIKCWVDDELAIDHTDDTVDTQDPIFLNGTIGLKVFGKPRTRAVVSFDDVLVEPLP
jgi:hypothetical protein